MCIRSNNDLFFPDTHFKVISDRDRTILNCTSAEYTETIEIVPVDFNPTVCNDSDEDILQQVSDLCNNKVKCEFELLELIQTSHDFELVLLHLNSEKKRLEILDRFFTSILDQPELFKPDGRYQS